VCSSTFSVRAVTHSTKRRYPGRVKAESYPGRLISPGAAVARQTPRHFFKHPALGSCLKNCLRQEPFFVSLPDIPPAGVPDGK
jgi:hypothetical protein